MPLRLLIAKIPACACDGNLPKTRALRPGLLPAFCGGFPKQASILAWIHAKHMVE